MLIGLLILASASSLILKTYLWESWIRDGPTEPVPELGAVHPYSDHGRIVYLDRNKQVIYYGMPFFTLILAGGIWWGFGARRGRS